MSNQTRPLFPTVWKAVGLAIIFPLGGYFIQSLDANIGSELSSKNIHILFAMGLSAAVTLFFGLQQRDVAAYSRREYELKQLPHVEFSDFRILEPDENHIKVSQEINNTGLGDVYVSSAVLTWTSIIFWQSSDFQIRGQCLNKIPEKIGPGESKTFEFRIMFSDTLDSTLTIAIRQRLQNISSIHAIEALVTYHLRNAGAAETRPARMPVYFSELAVQKSLGDNATAEDAKPAAAV